MKIIPKIIPAALLVGFVSVVAYKVYRFEHNSTYVAMPQRSMMLSWHGYRSVTLAWDKSPSTNVVGYNVYYGVKSGAYTNVIAAGSNLFLTVQGLDRFTTYYFAATALDSFGLESDFSVELKMSGLMIEPYRDVDFQETETIYEIWESQDLKTWALLDTTRKTSYPFYSGDRGFFRVKVVSDENQNN